MNEYEIIKKYFIKLANKKSSLNLNDDIFFDKKNKLAISVDTYIENIHFINFSKPDLVFKKIIRSSISDLICKGVYPKYFFIAVSGNKKHFTKKNLKKIYSSMKKEQNKFKISIGGGDTVKSNKLSISITSVGFSDKIVQRNNSKINDDVYVTGNLGDSYTGLCILKNRIKTDKSNKKFFIDKYYSPQLHLNFTRKLFKIANSSIDISDGLFADLEKLINTQKISYKVCLDKIPISNNLNKLLIKKNLKKINFVSNGDDYQILFTTSKCNEKMINLLSKKYKIRITKIGSLVKNKQSSRIFDNKGNQIFLKNKGYFHTF